VPVLAREIQRCFAGLHGRTRVRSARQQERCGIDMGLPGGLEGAIAFDIHGMMQQRHALLICVLDICSIVEDLSQTRQVLHLNCMMGRRQGAARMTIGGHERQR